ncbi:MAG: hypothetical protein WDZ51_06615 [Pirellulaceae bacterium]
MVQNLSSDLPVSRLLPRDHVPPLVLQIRGSERDGQIVRIRSTRCLVGHSTQAEFRLIAAGVRAKHCTLYRGTAGTLLKALCRDVRVNGYPVTEHLLRSGDLLAIGSVEFEVLPGNDAEDNPGPSLESTPSQRAALESQLREARGNGRNRVRHLIRTLRRIKDEEGESPANRSGDAPPRNDPYRTIVLEADGNLDQPNPDLRAEIAAVRRRGRLRVQACITRLRQLRDESAATKAELKRQTERARDLETERDQHLAEAEGLRQEVDQLRAQIREIERQLDEVREAVPDENQEELREALDHLRGNNDQLREDLAYLQASESQLRGEWQEVRAENQRLLIELESIEHPLRESEASAETNESVAESSEEAPVSSGAVFARLRDAGMLKLELDNAEAPEEQEYGEPADDVSAEESGGNRFSESEAPFSGAHRSNEPLDEDEEHAQSINDYVANLLKRTGHSTPGSHAAPLEPPKQPAPAKRVEPEFTEKLTQEQYRPKATAPERNADISQLREVANATAKAAIGSHSLNRWQRQLRNKVLSAGLALAAGCSLMSLIFMTEGADLPASLAAAIGLGMAAVWGVQAVLAYRQLQTSGRRITDVDQEAPVDRRSEPVAGRRQSTEERALADRETQIPTASADSAEE